MSILRPCRHVVGDQTEWREPLVAAETSRRRCIRRLANWAPSPTACSERCGMDEQRNSSPYDMLPRRRPADKMHNLVLRSRVCSPGLKRYKALSTNGCCCSGACSAQDLLSPSITTALLLLLPPYFVHLISFHDTNTLCSSRSPLSITSLSPSLSRATSLLNVHTLTRRPATSSSTSENSATTHDTPTPHRSTEQSQQQPTTPFNLKSPEQLIFNTPDSTRLARRVESGSTSSPRRTTTATLTFPRHHEQHTRPPIFYLSTPPKPALARHLAVPRRIGCRGRT